MKRTKTSKKNLVSRGYYVYNYNARGGSDFNKIIRGETSPLYYLKWGTIILATSALIGMGASYLSQRHREFNFFNSVELQQESTKTTLEKLFYIK